MLYGWDCRREGDVRLGCRLVHYSGIKAKILPACGMLGMTTEMEEKDYEIAANKISKWYNKYQKRKNSLTFQEYLVLIGKCMPVHEEVIKIFHEYSSEPEEIKATESFDRYYVRKRKEELDLELGTQSESKKDEDKFTCSPQRQEDMDKPETTIVPSSG